MGSCYLLAEHLSCSIVSVRQRRMGDFLGNGLYVGRMQVVIYPCALSSCYPLVPISG